MKTSLCKGLNEGDAEEIKGQFIAALRLRNRFIELANEKIRVADAESLSKQGYENASWAYKQADLIGYKRALNEIISLLEK